MFYVDVDHPLQFVICRPFQFRRRKLDFQFSFSSNKTFIAFLLDRPKEWKAGNKVVLL